ncbi:MFS transporter [Chromobacterium sp. ATCC 53434]|uniref:multidrug effflux MFS transporter n=1 Tax=Chromobacterium sp. (strain ATCC 53434 / SC 14030) TaxID=2059672 RepID=UPI000C771F22|nr:multidrug effflux MFS transporter [Chromobacterium sp. ATCC 53434]AUH52026.1 MFS transporter [Chromobacterium sp. ATCC 53434]
MKTTTRPALWLLTVLILFPQLVETIYSPALTDIAAAFGVSQARASQTLSIYFVAFAAGVALWGWLSDVLGRRPAMLLGLACYGAGSALALVAADFDTLLLARTISALGAAAGSVVVQTMLRDSYDSVRLARVFSLIGAALALSPVLGLLSGGWLAGHFGHRGVFTALLLLAFALLALTALRLPETRPLGTVRPDMARLAGRMLRDAELWRNAMLVALFNAMLFSYYSLAPFLFERLGWSPAQFGWSGAALAAASLSGSLLNRKLLGSGYQPARLLRAACRLALASGLAAWLLGDSAWILLPVAGVVVAFGVAIPNVLSQALRHYREQAGAAGALFGLSYYLLLGMMLALAGLAQNLGLVLSVCAAATLLCLSSGTAGTRRD